MQSGGIGRTITGAAIDARNEDFGGAGAGGIDDDDDSEFKDISKFIITRIKI